MSDERTDDQRAADEQLRLALEAVAAAYAEDESAGWVLTEYLCIYAQRGWDDEGDSCTAVGTAVDGDSTPIHSLLGLAEYASARYRKLITADYDD